MFVNPSSIVRGLVGALGAAGGSVGGTDKWSLIFHLTAWRLEGEVTRGELRCEMPVNKPDLDRFMSLIKAYSVVDVQVAKITERGTAMVDRVAICEANDPDLLAIRDELQIPVRIETPEFGVLELDRRFGCYNGKAVWCGHEVRISLSCSDATNPDQAISAAASLFQDQQRWGLQVNEFAVDQLLQLKNDTWLADDEAELSRSEFIAAMTLNEISIDDEGNFTFWHDDGDLFWGHAIQVNGTLSEGCTDADIPG